MTVTAFITVCMSGLLPTGWMWSAVLTAHAEACRAKLLLLDSDTLSTQTGHAIDSLKKENALPAVTDVAIGHLMKHTPDRFS